MSGSARPASAASTGDAPTQPVTLAALLRRTAGAFHRYTQEFAQARGLHPTDVLALVAVLDGDTEGTPVTPGALRTRLHLTSGAVTACIDRLERTGRIRRARDADDGRVVRLHHTAAGRAVAGEFLRPLADRTGAACQGLTPRELTVVARFLTRMSEELAQLGH